MSTITKEWLQQKIADMEAARDEIPFGLDEDDSNTLAAMKLALASLEAGPVGYIDAEYTDLIKSAHIESCSVYSEPGEGFIALYAAPPAPVSVPDLLEQFAEFMAAESIKSGDYPDGWQSKASNAAHEYAQNIRTAMLQGADGNSPVIQDGWVMVPVEPTKEMIDAGWSYYMTTKSPSSLGVYGAMLAAAPRQEVKP